MLVGCGWYVTIMGTKATLKVDESQNGRFEPWSKSDSESLHLGTQLSLQVSGKLLTHPSLGVGLTRTLTQGRGGWTVDGLQSYSYKIWDVREIITVKINCVWEACMVGVI